MRKLIALLAAVALALALAAPALAAEGSLSHSGRVLIGVGGDVSLPAGERADAVIVVGGHATVAGEANKPAEQSSQKRDAGSAMFCSTLPSERVLV